MANPLKFLGFNKLVVLRNLIKENGGVLHSLYKMYRIDDLLSGALVGTDKLGNKYYENKNYFYGRDRWVEYVPSVGTDYDASQVPSEWFGWLHHKTDAIPTKENRVQHSWIKDYTENATMSENAYMPYSTTKPKIEAWTPPKN